ncbi:MAG: ribonuclease III [Nannocystaceae bacterium]|nr:ribonuclease III [Nannocystaceae bacterium]
MTRLPKVLRALPEPDVRLEDGTEPTPEDGLEALQVLLGYRFADPALLRVALTLGSWANEHTDAGWPSNACLEFFGDAVLDLVAADAVWRRFPELAEGELTRLRATLVAEASLVRVASALGLGRFLYLGRGDLKRGGREHASTLADAVEAVLGAVFLDAREAGRQPEAAAAEVFEAWLGSRVESLQPQHGLDAKSRLQHWAQAKHRVTPRYERVGDPPPPGEPAWRAQVTLRFPNGTVKVLGEGEGRSLKRAEQAAALAALAVLPAE